MLAIQERNAAKKRHSVRHRLRLSYNFSPPPRLSRAGVVAVLLSTLCLCGIPFLAVGATISDTPWNQYFGASEGAHDWGTVTRIGSERPTQIAIALGDEDVVLGDGIGMNSGRNASSVRNHMNSIEQDGGRAFSEAVKNRAIEVVQTIAKLGTTHDAFWQFGNEINSNHYSKNYRSWANGNTSGAMKNDTFSISLYAEYYLAPAIEGIHDAENTTGRDIQILLGSIGTAYNADSRAWMDQLLDYELQGWYAPSLAGTRVASLVDFIDLHYLVSADNHLDDENGKNLNDIPDSFKIAMDEVHSNWVQPGWVRGIWATEELGGQRAQGGFGGATSIRVWARNLHWWNENAFSPERVRSLLWGTTRGSNGTTGNEAMSTLFGFLGASPLKEYVDSLDAGSDEFETYLFESINEPGKRVAVALPRDSRLKGGAIEQLVMEANGWSTGDISAEAYVFSSKGIQTMSAWTTSQGGSLTIDLANRVTVNGDRATVVVFLQRL